MGASEPIAIVVASLAGGGAERVALNLAEEFHARGRAVDLVLVSAKGALLDQVPAGVRVVSLDSPRARSAALKLRRYMAQAAPSAVLSIAFHVNILTALAILGLRRRPRLVLSVHNPISRSVAALGWRSWAWLRAGTRLLYGRADAVVAVSHGAADDIARAARLDPARVHTIHNPVLRGDFEALAAEIPGHPWASKKTRPLVVSAGRLSLQKNPALLIRAFAKVAAATDARLLVLGEGSLRPQLEELIASLGLNDAVALAGYVSNPLPYMKAADVFALSSDWEGFGNVLVEAMATGTPVVSTDCPNGPREILENGKWGRLVPVGDEDALAGAIIETLRSGGIDGRRRAQDFTVEVAATKYLGLLSG